MSSLQNNQIATSYTADWEISSCCWCTYHYESSPLRLGVLSYIENRTNKVQIIGTSNSGRELRLVTELLCEYPATKIQWKPNHITGKKDLFAVSSDMLRVYSTSDDGKKIGSPIVLHNNRRKESINPITSFDWNSQEENIIAACSVDTTCTLWDINTKKSKYSLVAHDKEVFDIQFNPQDSHIFTTLGADGSMRLFDCRTLETCSVLYESTSKTPLLRLSWNMADEHIIAATQLDSPRIILIDTRKPLSPLCYLDGHGGCINSICWAPQSSKYLVSGSDDSNCYIWNISLASAQGEPILCYHADNEVNHVVWSHENPNTIAMCQGTKVELLQL